VGASVVDCRATAADHGGGGGRRGPGRTFTNSVEAGCPPKSAWKTQTLAAKRSVRPTKAKSRSSRRTYTVILQQTGQKNK
jgi:hypothetical protein